MSNITRWATGKNPLFANAAISLVIISDFIYKLIPQAKDRRLFDYQFSQPDYSTWFHFYQSPGKPLKSFSKLISLQDGGSSLIGFLSLMRRFHKRLKHDPLYFEKNPLPQKTQDQLAKHWAGVSTFAIGLLQNDLDPPHESAEQRYHYRIFLKEHQQELAFCFFLYIPALLTYQTTPHALYRNAITGDFDSIEKLLKLDPLMQSNPVIGKQINALRFANKINDYERLSTAHLKSVEINFSKPADARKHYKYTISAIISEMSKAFREPLNAPQIEALFNAFSKDRHAAICDTDLPTAESFKKAIDRNAAPWQKLFLDLDNKK